MTITTNTGGPAFPQSDKIVSALSIADSQGMTLRDYFAAKAMQACIPDRRNQFKEDNEYYDDWDSFFCIIAEEAYGIADAMLEERSA